MVNHGVNTKLSDYANVIEVLTGFWLLIASSEIRFYMPIGSLLG